MLSKEKSSGEIFAIKVISKEMIIEKVTADTSLSLPHATYPLVLCRMRSSIPSQRTKYCSRQNTPS